MSEAIQKQLQFDGVGEEKKWDLGFCGRVRDVPPEALMDLENTSDRVKAQYLPTMEYAKKIVSSGILGGPGENYELFITADLNGIMVNLALFQEEVPTTLEEAAEKLL